MDQLHVKVEPIEGNELVIRQGDALPLKEPKKLEFIGEIDSVKKYIKKRMLGLGNPNYVDTQTAIIVVNADKLSITLDTNQCYPYSATIKGQLQLTEELKRFGINSPTTFGREEFVKLLRFSRLFFADRDEHEKVLKSYQQFKATTSQDLNASSDQRGNKSLGYEKKVSTGLPENFALLLPIYKGQKPTKFLVDICVDVTEASARFWLESVELEELLMTQRDNLIIDALDGLEDYAILYQ